MVEEHEKPHKTTIYQQGIFCSICRAATGPSSPAYAADGTLNGGPHLFSPGRGTHVPAAPTVLETPLYTHSWSLRQSGQHGRLSHPIVTLGSRIAGFLCRGTRY